MNKPKTFKVPTVAVLIKHPEEISEVYNLNEYEFTNLRLEYAKGMWKGCTILTWFRDANGQSVSGFIGHDGASHPMLPPQFAVIDKMHLDMFSLKFGELAHWEEAKAAEKELQELRRKKIEQDERDYQEYLKSL